MTKYFQETTEPFVPVRVEANDIAYYDVTGGRVNWDYNRVPNEEFYKSITKEQYDEIFKPLRKQFLRWQMIEHMKDFEKIWNKMNETWQDMDSEDWDLLGQEYPFYNSFDEIKIPAWIETVKKNFKLK